MAARYTHRLQIMMTPKQAEALETIAAASGTSLPHVARYFLPASASREELADLAGEGVLERLLETYLEDRDAA